MAHAGQNKKAIRPVILDVREISGITDYFVILSGNTETQAKAIMNEVDRVCHEEKVSIAHIEGTRVCTWVLVDLHDVIVHVFTEKERNYYNLEKLWKDAKRVNLPKL
ncbi:ribosome silencing factor [bacterium]|nr:ribosome silencing factor [bacterium]